MTWRGFGVLFFTISPQTLNYDPGNLTFPTITIIIPHHDLERHMGVLNDPEELWATTTNHN